MHDRQFQFDRNKQQPESHHPTASPASTTCNVDQPGILKLGDVIEIECGPLSAEDTDTSAPAIELLRKLGFGKEQKEWPSLTFGPVLPDVLEQLKRAHQILTSRGFVFVDDPLNPLGDGKSWVLKCEPPLELPKDSDPARLAHRYLQKQGIKVATRPVLDGETLLIPLWDSGKDSCVLEDDFEPVRDFAKGKAAVSERNPARDLKSDDSVFWRKLNKEFRRKQADRFNAGEVNASEPGTVVEDLMTPGAVESLMRQGGAKLATAGGPDEIADYLKEHYPQMTAQQIAAAANDGLVWWFKELKERGISIPMSGQKTEVMPGAAFEQSITEGYLDGLYQASVTLCDILATEAEEREEKQRSTLGTEPDPRNHSSLLLGEWAETYLPELKDFVSQLRAGKTPEAIRTQFEPLFSQVIDRLEDWHRKELFKAAQGSRYLNVPDLMEYLAQVKGLAGATLSDYRKHYRRKSGTARTRQAIS